MNDNPQFDLSKIPTYKDLLEIATNINRLAETQHKRMVELEQRVAALEAQSAPDVEPEYTPGWVTDGGEIIQCGMAEKATLYPDIVFWYENGNSRTSFRVCQYTPNEHRRVMEKVELTKTQLRQLIGAAQAVRKRMEAEQSDE